MKHTLALVLAAALYVAPAGAQTPPVAPPATANKVPATISPDDKKAFDEMVSLVRIAQLWGKSLEWNETGSTTADVVAHLKKALGNESPTIELRSKDTSRSTFVLKMAPLGPTLSALTDLANLKVWVFPNRLLLAPEAELSQTEQTAVREGRGGEWQSSSAARGSLWSPEMAMEIKGASLVALDLKGHFPLKATTTETTTPPLITQPDQTTPPVNPPVSSEAPSSYQLTFAQLSPVAQEVLQELLNQKNRQEPSPTRPTQLALTTQVELDQANPNYQLLRLYIPKLDAPNGREEIARWNVPSQIP